MATYTRDLMPFQHYLELARTQARNSSISIVQGAITNLQLAGIAQEIGQLRADFDWALGEVLLRFDLQQKGLEAILGRIQAPLDTRAKELRRRAEYAYEQGWFEEALSDFLESERKNYQDFTIYEAVANIFLYHREPPGLDKAREYYLKFSKYAAPVGPKLSALGYMYAGFVCYLQRDDSAAIRYEAEATQSDPDLTEAFYNHAKFAAAAGQTEIALPSLRTAALRNRKYLERAINDPDFGGSQAGSSLLVEKVLSAVYSAVETEIARHSDLPEALQAKARALMAKASEQIQAKTNSAYLDALAAIGAVARLLEDRSVVVRRIAGGSENPGFFDVVLDGAPAYRGVLKVGDTIKLRVRPGRHVLDIKSHSTGHSSVSLTFELEEDMDFVWGLSEGGLFRQEKMFLSSAGSTGANNRTGPYPP
jgi:hypothetical protein